MHLCSNPSEICGDKGNCMCFTTTYEAFSGYVSEQADLQNNLENSLQRLSIRNRQSIKNHLYTDDKHPLVTVPTARDIVLRRCGQTEPLPFETCYPPSTFQNCQKIGEGLYGEVFLFRNQNGGTTVMKVIPIEGSQIVNGERQKKFEEILSEIIISMELSNLRNTSTNATNSFAEVKIVKCVKGIYPDRLLELWELYAETHHSENDSPELFKKNQLYIVLELANGGKDLESFEFTNAFQAYTMFKQLVLGLAVAETELLFEHRDLHWGNILIKKTDKAKVSYRLNGSDLEIDSNGIEVSLIDFTLSRIEYDGVNIFNDLSRDNEYFEADGDYQFEIYRLMQQKVGNNWSRFEPYTNILWLHYVLDKTIEGLRYKNAKSIVHKDYMKKLAAMKNVILSFNSCKELICILQ